MDDGHWVITIGHLEHLLCWWQSQTEAFSAIKGMYVTPKINDPIWQGFKLIREFIHVHLICKYKEDPFKLHEQVVLMTQLSRDFFSVIKGDVLLRLMIQSGQVLNSSKISSMSTLSASFRKSWSKQNELCWWQSQTEAFSAIKGM